MAGIGYYNTLPDGWRQAKESDFYHQGVLLVGVKYLLKNSSGQYEGYCTKAHTIHGHINNIFAFITLEKAFVLE
jgi:hypothetical protein